MLHIPTPVSLTNQAGMKQITRMLRDGLSICLEGVGDIPHSDAGITFNKKKNLNSMVVSNTLKMPLHLLGCFGFPAHNDSIALYPHNSQIICRLFDYCNRVV